MKANFERCLSETLKHEGGWADHPSDPGGATMKGVTIATFAKFKGRSVSKAELRAISNDDLYAIYRRDFWNAIRGDDLPIGLDLVAFDAAVNSGPRRGARWLQAALGANADGVIGPQTLALSRAADPRAAIDRACDMRMQFLRRLNTWPTFANGWRARVAAVRRVAKDMTAVRATDAPPASTPETQPGWLARFFAALFK